MAHPTPSVYLMLIGESILLLVGLIGASFVSQKLLNLMGNKMNPSTGPAAHERHPWTLTITSIVCQIVLMALLMPLLVKDPLKIQALVGVFVSAGVATALSGTFFHRPPLAAWICVGPMLVAIIGYALAWSNPGLISIGLTSQPLAGAIPLDYASVGSAGAIIGSWYSAKHKLNWLDIIVSRVSGQPMPQAIERA